MASKLTTNGMAYLERCAANQLRVRTLLTDIGSQSFGSDSVKYDQMVKTLDDMVFSRGPGGVPEYTEDDVLCVARELYLATQDKGVAADLLAQDRM